MIPYSCQNIDESDIEAVSAALREELVTGGRSVSAFERGVADYVGARKGVAVSSGTAALHSAFYAAGIGQGDEVVVPALTFAATANAVVYLRGRPVFADVDESNLLLDVSSVRTKITDRTKAVVAVDYTGQPCDYAGLRGIADQYGLVLVADGCHALGASDAGQMVGTLADMTVFSFHAVKPITTGEGGMVVTDRASYAEKMRSFRNHGIDLDFSQRKNDVSWYYEMTDLGFNYRITDFQCALGLSQLGKLPQWLQRRHEIASIYDSELSHNPLLTPLVQRDGTTNARHLYVVKVAANVDRDAVFKEMRASGIGVNVHYIPVHLHPYYRREFDTGEGMCPTAERVYHHILSLPIFPAMNDDDVAHVVHVLNESVNRNAK